MLIRAHSLFGVPLGLLLIQGFPLGLLQVRVPIGDPRVWGSHWGCSWVWGSHWAAPGQGLGGPWPLGPPKGSWPFGTPLGHPPRPPGLGFPLGRSWVCGSIP